ncbi:MAG: FAD-dependent oxidoreductase [Cyanobacteria bacterium J06607_10]
MISQTVVLGADPAGLTAAYELTRFGTSAITVLEPSGHIGGLARTENYHGYRIDLGGGALSTQTKSVRKLWESLLPEDSVSLKVRSRIHYRHRLFEHPLTITNSLKHLGPIDIGRAGISYFTNWFLAQQQQTTEARSADEWLTRRFGAHISRLFFRPYLEKVWGRPCHQLAASCAQQALRDRKSNSLLHATLEALVGNQDNVLHYPKKGAGSPWKNCANNIEQSGHHIALNTQIIHIEHADHKIQTIIATDGHQLFTRSVDHLISSLPLPQLTKLLNAPPEVSRAANQLKYRHIIQVALVIKAANLFPEHWIYVHHPHVKTNRIQNFKNWSADMVTDADKTCLGVTYFCDETDALWQRSEGELIAQAKQELIELGLVLDKEQIETGTVLKQTNAYPIPTVQDDHNRAIVQSYLNKFENLQTIGRNGLHHYAGLESCILSGQQSAETILNNTRAERSSTQKEFQPLDTASN